MIWTKKAENLLRKQWGQMPASEIAVAFGVSRDAVIGKAHKLGLPAIAKQQSNEWASRAMLRRGRQP